MTKPTAERRRRPAAAQGEIAQGKAPANDAIRKVGVVARSDNREALRTAAELAEWLAQRDLEVAVDDAILRARDLAGFAPYEAEHNHDLVVVFGGDGTLLGVARSVPPGVPILGVNLGRLGFLTELTRKSLYPSLVKVLSGHYKVDERTLYEVELRRAAGATVRFRAFNDAVIAKSALARIIELELKVDGQLVSRFRSDGLIVSTPNGSTAYNMSAGGPIVYPALPVAVLTPICPHSLSLRPIVVPDSRPIEITLRTESEEVFLTVDGQEGQSLGYRDTVMVKRSAFPVDLIRMRGRTFYANLRHKLNWGG